MTIKGSCHCKATAFEVSAAPENVTHCTCSFCSKRGVAVGVLYAVAIHADDARGESLDLSLGFEDDQAPFLRRLRLRHLHRDAGLVDRET